MRINEDSISLAEDNGEVGCGDLLSSCLTDIQEASLSCMVCVTRYIEGTFVVDMYQGQKHRVVKEAASKAVQLLLKSLANNTASPQTHHAVTAGFVCNPHQQSNSNVSGDDNFASVHVTSKVTRLTLDISSSDDNLKVAVQDGPKSKNKPFK